MKKFYLSCFILLLFLTTNISIHAQNTCCNALNGGFASFCIGGISGCAANSANCNDAVFDAAFGPDSYIGFTCTVETFCVPANCNGGVSSAMPVEFQSFELEIQERGVMLKWITATEINNEGFQVQSSTDGKEWTNIDFVKGLGNSNETANYSFIHFSPKMGINYYRLKQVDFDGQFDYSETAVAVWQGGVESPEMVMIPNPARSWITPYFPPEMAGADELTFFIFDISGKKVYEGTHPLNQEGVKLDISGLNNGNYVVRVNHFGKLFNAQFVKID